MTYLDELRERPHNERVALSGWAAVGTVLVLFLVWSSFFIPHASQSVVVQSQNASTAAAGLSDITADMQSALKDMNTQYTSARELLDELSAASAAASAAANQQENNSVHLYKDSEGNTQVSQ